MNVLGIFVKQPVPGEVKTRLGAEIGDEHAAALYAAFTGDIADRFRNSGQRRFLCFTPDDDRARAHFSGLAADDYGLWPQPESSLGERLASFFEYVFAQRAERVVVIGSDSPTLPESFVQSAFEKLAHADCVLGPATDGGYYLVGQRSPGWGIFDKIDWGGPQVLAQTVERIADSEASLALLSPWYDIDNRADLNMLQGHDAAMRQAGEAVQLERTSAVGRFH